MTARTLCCNKPMMGLGGDPTRAVVCWNPYNGVVSCHACGTIYVDSKDPKDYDRWCDAGGGMEQDRAPVAAPTILESATNMVKSFAATDCYGATLCSPTSRCLPCRSRALLEEKGL